MKTYIIILIGMLLFSCEKDNIESNVDGKVVGYMKCCENNSECEMLFGTFIITNNKDSLLSFDIAPSTINVDTSLIDANKYGYNGPEVTIGYRKSNENEIINFFCPPDYFFQTIPGFLRDMSHFTQVKINNLKVNE